MLGGGAEVSVGFLKELQSVLYCHLQEDRQTDRQLRQLAVGLKVVLTEKKKKIAVAGAGVMVGMNSISMQLS